MDISTAQQVKVSILHMFYEERTHPVAECMRSWTASLDDLKILQEASVSTLHSWQIGVLMTILEKHSGKELEIDDWIVKSGNPGIFTYNGVFYCELSFIVAEGYEHRLFRNCGNATIYCTVKKISSVSSIEKVIQKYFRERESNFDDSGLVMSGESGNMDTSMSSYLSDSFSEISNDLPSPKHMTKSFDFRSSTPLSSSSVADAEEFLSSEGSPDSSQTDYLTAEPSSLSLHNKFSPWNKTSGLSTLSLYQSCPYCGTPKTHYGWQACMCIIKGTSQYLAKNEQTVDHIFEDNQMRWLLWW